MRSTAAARDGAPKPTSGCGAGNQLPPTASADTAKDPRPGLECPRASSAPAVTTAPTFAQVFCGDTRQLGPASNAQGPPGTGTPALCRRSLPSKLFEHLPPCLLDRTRGWPLEGKAAATLSSGTPQRFFMHARVQQWWLHATTLFARGSKGWLDFDVLYAHARQLELWEQYARLSSKGDAHVD